MRNLFTLTAIVLLLISVGCSKSKDEFRTPTCRVDIPDTVVAGEYFVIDASKSEAYDGKVLDSMMVREFYHSDGSYTMYDSLICDYCIEKLGKQILEVTVFYATDDGSDRTCKEMFVKEE